MGEPCSHCSRLGSLGVPFDPKLYIWKLLLRVTRGPLRFTRVLSIAGSCPLWVPDDMV